MQHRRFVFSPPVHVLTIISCNSVQQFGDQSQRSFPAQEGGSVFEDTDISDMLAGKAKEKAAGGGMSQASRWVCVEVVLESTTYRFNTKIDANDDDAHFIFEEWPEEARGDCCELWVPA